MLFRSVATKPPRLIGLFYSTLRPQIPRPRPDQKSKLPSNPPLAKSPGPNPPRRFRLRSIGGRGIRKGDLGVRTEAIEGSSHERGVRGLRAPVLRGLRLPLTQVHRRLRSRWRYVINCPSAPPCLLPVSSNTVGSPQRRRSRGSPRYNPASRKLNRW